jgi:hypothetical protein
MPTVELSGLNVGTSSLGRLSGWYRGDAWFDSRVGLEVEATITRVSCLRETRHRKRDKPKRASSGIRWQHQVHATDFDTEESPEVGELSSGVATRRACRTNGERERSWRHDTALSKGNALKGQRFREREEAVRLRTESERKRGEPHGWL